MLLGQLVAISVAANLFFLAVLLSPPAKKGRETTNAKMTPPILWISVLLSLVTIGISPYTTERTFLPNLLTMHTLIILPLLPFGYNTASRFSIPTRRLYLLTALIGGALRARSTLAAFISLTPEYQSASGFLAAAWHTLHSHPAQSSIGWDVIWTTISFLAWYAISSPSPSASAGTEHPTQSVLIDSLLFSVGVSAPLALRSRVDEADMAQKKEQ